MKRLVFYMANVTEINGFAYFIIAKHGDFCVEIAWRLVTLMSLRFLTNNILGGNNYNYVPPKPNSCCLILLFRKPSLFC